MSEALTLVPSPASKTVSLPTTTTPPFMVPKAGRQRRVTVEGGRWSIFTAFILASDRNRFYLWRFPYRLYSASAWLDTSPPSGFLADSERAKTALWCLILSLHERYNNLPTYQFGKVHTFLAVLPVVLMVVFVAHLGLHQGEVPVRTTLHTQLENNNNVNKTWPFKLCFKRSCLL